MLAGFQQDGPALARRPMPLRNQATSTRSGKQSSCFQLLDDSRAVAMTLDLDAQSVQQGQPGIAQRRITRQYQMLAELETRAAPREDHRAIVEIMDRANVAAVGQDGMIQERAAVGFGGGLKLVQQ